LIGSYINRRFYPAHLPGRIWHMPR
jgi:hypothetical protein